ncbi:MAG: MBL fold metallo-hydrolase [Promethearchaeota archaeon]|jgi:ribonuclease J
MDSSVKLTFYGGVNKVGGNKVLLEDNEYDVRIFIDFGLNSSEIAQSRKINPDPTEVRQLTENHVIPREEDLPIKNLYSKYYIYDHKKQKYYQKVKDCQEKVDPPSNLDGILISHPHRDHYQGLSFINRNIPIYAGVVTKRIIKASSLCTPPKFDNFLYGLHWIRFRTGNVINIKGLEVFPIHVDHSIPAAYGFIINTSAGIIVYSGDFRMHGPLQLMTADLIRKTKELSVEKGKNVITLICEGTHINKGAIESERTVKQHLKKLFSYKLFDYVLVHYDRVDWDRFRTYVNIAKKHNWKFIITEKDAYFYNRLNKKALYKTMKDPNIESNKNILILSQDDTKLPWKRRLNELLGDKAMIERRISLNDLKSLEGKFLVYFASNWDYNKMKNYLPSDLRGAFICSNIDPYAEDYRFYKNKISNELLNKGIPSYRIHASGHAKPHDLIRYIKEINPENLIPIHTNHGELFEKLFRGEAIKIIIPIREIPIEITG